MTQEPHFRDDEERQISRGGKRTAIWLMSAAVVVIAGGVALAMLIRDNVVSPPSRPGTTSATTPAGEVKPPSP
jgi:hypothetical protein